MNALIDPTTIVQHIVRWDSQQPPVPVYMPYPNSAKICQVQADTFPVAEPLFWASCDDTITPEGFWYNTETGQFEVYQDAPEPPKQQPVGTGVQTL